MKLTLASLFDGSGTAPLAASMCGITPVWASEIEPYPIRVTTKRFPNMKHYGSITDIDGGKVDPVDIICGGSPCQDLSVAGKQAGLDGGTRSHLFYEMVRIIKEMRKATDGKKPRYIVWENVPGAFSSNNGYDFLSVLQSFAEIAETDVHVPEPERKANKLVWRYAGEMVGCGWSIAWRTVDAQYWGVPQRRRRIYLVVDLDSERAGEILFERKSLSGNIEPGRETGKRTAGDAEGSTHGSSGVRCLNPWDTQSIRQYSINGVYPTLSSNATGGLNRSGVCFAIDPMNSNSMKSPNPHSGFHEEEYSKCLDTSDNKPNKNRGENLIVERTLAIPFAANQRDEVRLLGDKAGALQAEPGMKQQTFVLQGNGIDRADTAGCNGKGWKEDTCYTPNTIDRPAVVFPTCARTLTAEADASPCVDRGQNVVVYDARGNGDGHTAPTLTGDHENRVTDYTAVCAGRKEAFRMTAFGEYAHDGTGSAIKARDYKDATDLVVEAKPPRRYIVRRLTPLECSRLQGFPDCWELDLETPNPTEEDIEFWTEVFETHRKVVSPDVKPRTRNQIIKWLKDPYSDSASYKMWGNGMALPNMLFVISRIKEMHDNA